MIKREKDLVALHQRDDEWMEELAERDSALRAEFREREKAFISEQLNREQELLKILEVRDKEMEQNLLQKADALGYLYKEHQKEIRVTIQMRDEELEAFLNYREKLWTESLDMVNANMIKMYNAQGEFEAALNSIGGRQDEPMKSNAIMLDWLINQQIGNRIEARPQPSISEYIPYQASYQYEPVNLKPSKS